MIGQIVKKVKRGAGNRLGRDEKLFQDYRKNSKELRFAKKMYAAFLFYNRPPSHLFLRLNKVVLKF